MNGVEQKAHAAASTIATPATNGAIPDPHTSATDVSALRPAIESLFSKENLERSPLLLAYISSKMSVPLQIVAQHLGYADVSGDFSALTSAIQDSNVCVATPDGGIKPTYKQQQHTVIVRDVPSNTPVDTILNILREKGCKGYKSIRSELNDTWFITFEAEQDARDSLFAIRDATLNDKPIRARLKTESIAKSFYQAAVEQAQAQAWQSTMPYQYVQHPNQPHQRFQHNRVHNHSHHHPQHQTQSQYHSGNGGPRSNRYRSRRHYVPGPAADETNQYHAMRMQAMWATQFGQQPPTTYPHMFAVQMQPESQPTEPAPRGAPRRRDAKHDAKSSNHSNRQLGPETQQMKSDLASGLDHTPLAGTGESTSPLDPPVQNMDLQVMNGLDGVDGHTEEPRTKRASSNIQARQRRSNGAPKKDFDATSPRNSRSEGGRKQFGKRKTQPRRSESRKPREAAPEFTDADFPLLSTTKPSNSAADLSWGYAEALKRGPNSREQTSPVPAAPPVPKGSDQHAQSVEAFSTAPAEDGEITFGFLAVAAESTPSSSGDRADVPAVKAEAADPIGHPSRAPNAEPDDKSVVQTVTTVAQPVTTVAQATDFESFPCMESSGPSTSKTTVWTGKKSFLDALRQQDQAA